MSLLARDLATAAVCALTAGHVAAGLAGARRLADVTQPLLMPAVAARLLTVADPRRREVRGVLAALAASWLGDTVPRFRPGDGGFRTMVACFAVAHAAYVWAFAPAALARLRSRPSAALPPLAGYAAVLTAVIVPTRLPARDLGLDAAIDGYGALLAATGVVLALRGGRVAIGGATFAGSDAVLALARFAPGWRQRLGRAEAVLVMTTYVAAQCLIADGVAAD